MMKTDISLSQRLSKYVSQSILSTVGASIYVLADSFFVAKSIGVLGIAVMNLTMPLFNVMEGLGLLLGMGGGTLFTIYQIKNPQKSQRIYTQTFIMGVILGLFFTLCGILFVPQIAHLIGATHNTYEYTIKYIRLILLCGPFFVLNNLLLSFARNDNGIQIAMMAMVISSFGNIFLDWFLILKLNLGIIGASIATSLSPFISILITILHLKSPHNHLKFIKFKFKKEELLKLITIGAPSFLTEMSTGVGIFIYNWVFLKVSGNDAVAAYGIAANVLLVALALFTGVAQGIQPIVSQYYAKKNFNAIKFGLHFGLIIAEILGIICLIFVYLKSNLIIDFFNAGSNYQVVKMTTIGIKILLISLLFSSLNVIFNIFFSAINNSHISIFMVILRGYGLPLIIVILMAKFYGILGVWSSLTVIEMISLIFELSAWFFIKKKLKENDFTI